VTASLVIVTKIRTVQEEVTETLALLKFIALEMIVGSVENSCEYLAASTELITSSHDE
jgi:hypothetical protein